MRQLILDTETTGLYPEKGHRIIEFAALEMIDRKLTGNYLQLYINPEREIDADATKIHGIKNEDVIDKPVFRELVEQIIEYIKDAELIIHNAKFDLSFMDYQFKLHNYQSTQNYVKNVIDTLNMARQKFPGGKNSLDALCDKFNIDRSKRDYHGALIDCALLADVYLALTREQISLLADEQNNISNSIDFKQIDTSKLNLKIIEPNSEELALHNEYLKVLDKESHGKSLWLKKSENS